MKRGTHQVITLSVKLGEGAVAALAYSVLGVIEDALVMDKTVAGNFAKQMYKNTTFS